MQDLPWIVDPKLHFPKRVAILRAWLRWHEVRVDEAEAEVVARRHRLLLIDNALQDYIVIRKQKGGLVMSESNSLEKAARERIEQAKSEFDQQRFAQAAYAAAFAAFTMAEAALKEVRELKR